jgi:hypothetical protein
MRLTHRLRTASLLATSGILAACAGETEIVLVTVADARQEPASYIDTGDPGDSVGDLAVFDQPLLTENGVRLGDNSGVCIRTKVGHSYQCQWTLTLADGTFQVAGREAGEGTSFITIVGGTGAYTGASGEMESVNNGDGTFTQTLRYRSR